MLLTTVATWTTKGAESFRVIEKVKSVVVRFPDDYPDPIREFYPDSARGFSALKRALFTLGGIVPWECWTEETREALRAVNDGKAI